MSSAWLFPGQGSHSVAMLDAWAAVSPVVRVTLAEADDALAFPMSKLIADGPGETLNDTYNQQPALVVAGVAIARALREGDLASEPAFVAGHSVGEFAALIVAGALSFEDGLRLVRERARLMAESGVAQPGGMAAILGLDTAAVQSVCDATDGVQVANDNAPGQVVISGTRAAVEQASQALRDAGAKRVIPVRITVAAHSDLMAPAAEAFEKVLTEVSFSDPRIPVVGNVEAEPMTTREAVVDELRRQLTSGVRWTGTIERMLEEGVATFAEVGPGRVLGGLVKRVARAHGAQVDILSWAEPPTTAQGGNHG
jgi:[acyl-carrier-protein] S-malonyltransferase